MLLLALLKAAGIAAETWLARPENNPKLKARCPMRWPIRKCCSRWPKMKGERRFCGWTRIATSDRTSQGFLRRAQAIRLPTRLNRKPDGGSGSGRCATRGGIPARLAQAQPDAKWPTLTDTRRWNLSPSWNRAAAPRSWSPETLTGIQSRQWRDQVEHMAEDRLRQLLAAPQGYYFPGASLQSAQVRADGRR